MFWLYHILNFWFPWLCIFGLIVTNVLKCQISNICQFKSQSNYINFSEMKQSKKLKEIPRDALKLHPMTFKSYKC